MNKKGASSPWPIVVLVIAGLFLFYPQISNMLGGEPAAPADDDQPVDIGFICPVDSTTLSFAAVDTDDPGTVVTVDARLWVEGVPQGTVSTADDTGVSPGDTLKAWFAAGDATYYGDLFNGDAEVPCKGTYSVPGTLWTKDTGVTVTILDENSKVVGTEANITMDPGSEESVTFRVKGTHEEYYGNPAVSMDNLLTVEYNPSEVVEIVVLKDGVELADAAVPLVETVSATGNREIGFEMPKIAGSSKVDYDVTLRADDLDDPDAGDTVVLKIYDADYFYNSNTGDIDMG